VVFSNILDIDLEGLSQSELYQRVDKKKLLEQAKYILENSDFYAKKLKHFKNAKQLVDNFDSVPFTDKNEIIQDQIKFPPFGSNLCVKKELISRIHRTSGTTGRPVYIALTKNDIKAVIASGARTFWASGLRPKDTVFHCLNYCMWMGGFTDHQSLEATGATVVPYGVGNSNNLIELILSIKPTAIHCTVSYMAKLELLLENEFKIHPADLGLKIGLFAGEGGIQNPNFRRKIEHIWGLKAMDANYGVSDVLSMFGGECLQQNGLHFTGQGNVHVELIDSDSGVKLPIEKGVRGEFVLSNINRESQPLIRFRTCDAVEIISHTKCRCGRQSFRFKILGRSDDMIVVKGINIFPGAVGSVILDFLSQVTGEFQVIVKKQNPVEYIKVMVESKEDNKADGWNLLQSQIERKIKDKLEVKAHIELVPKGSLPRTEGKIRRLVWCHD